MPSRQPPLPVPSSSAPSPAAALLHQQHRHHQRHLSVKAVAATAIVVVALVAALVTALWWRRRRKRAAAEPEGTKGTVRCLSYRQLWRATAGFAAGNKLGQGGFGPVFRGALPPEKGRGGRGRERPVAVKVMDASGSLQGEREFHNEIAVASHLLSSGSASTSEEALCSNILLPFAYSMPACGGEARRPRRMMLVYDLMPNGSLQDALLGAGSCRRPDLVSEWPRRLAVARDVAAALHYLHSVVEPPVVHGDVKPSNVLLDADLKARLADFGLARVCSDPDPEGKPVSGVIAEGDGMIAEGADANGNPNGGCDDDVSVVAESTVTTTVNGEGNGAPKSPEDDEAFTSASPAEAASTSGFDRTSVDSGTNSRSCNGGSRSGGATASGTGSDWWWPQDNGAPNIGVKDYVMEWIRSEIKKERPKSDWVAGTAVNNPVAERKKSKRRAREWWREDYVDELAKKQKRRALAKSKSQQVGLQWWERDIDDDFDEKEQSKWNLVKSWSRRSSNCTSNCHGSINWCVNGARSSRDWASGELVPKSGGTVSSTPSMRGTVCYVAPEYGGGGPLSEKCDIYSYGVLLLVLVSGRRPLQVMASPMSEFEKASLISWARHLARASSLLDLVDPALRDVNRDEALLCITIALLCIQRSPACRPSSEELLQMLSCEGELPNLPLEFSPSPPGGFPFKSRKKVRCRKGDGNLNSRCTRTVSP